MLEPSETETLDILKGLSERYERHHRCVYAEEALEAAVALSHRYIADRFMPDKVCCSNVFRCTAACVLQRLACVWMGVDCSGWC